MMSLSADQDNIAQRLRVGTLLCFVWRNIMFNLSGDNEIGIITAMCCDDNQCTIFWLHNNETIVYPLDKFLDALLPTTQNVNIAYEVMVF